MSDSTPKTHQTITAIVEISVPIGDYCYDYSPTSSRGNSCWHLSGSVLDEMHCEIFGEDLKLKNKTKLIKCTKCKEAEVKI